MRQVSRVIPIVVAVVAALASAAIGGVSAVSGADSSANCENWTGGQPSPNQTSKANGVTVISQCDAWLVGRANDHSWSSHWKGAAWHNHSLPDPTGATTSELNAIAATSASNMWAVGYAVTSGVFRALAVHWNGTAWSLGDAKQPGQSSILFGAAATSATDAWAVGWLNNGTTMVPLIEHWNGSTWKLSAAPPLPTGGVNGVLTSVVASSSTNAWAVGDYYDAANNVRSLIVHWDGSRWIQQASKNPSATTNFLYGVTATSNTNAWAVGVDFNAGYRTLIERWNGTKWQLETSPNTRDFTNWLTGVTAVSATNAWAVGRRVVRSSGGVDQQPQTLILHWDGTRWTIVPSPNPGGAGQENRLDAVDASSPANVWAAGAFWNGNNEQALAIHCC